MAKFLRICEWSKYQHYKDRNPPWIKLHSELLTSYTWTTLDDCSRLLAIVCMLLAARTENKIPLDRDFIKRSAYLCKRPDIRPLIECGFVEVIETIESVPNASIPYQMLQNVGPETETETETETEKQAQSTFVLPDWVSRKDWDDFEDMRKKVSKGMTDRARALIVSELFKLKQAGSDVPAVLQQSIRNSWRDVFALKGTGNGRANEPHRTAQHARFEANVRAVTAGLGLAGNGHAGSGSGGVGDKSPAAGTGHETGLRARGNAPVEGEVVKLPRQ